MTPSRFLISALLLATATAVAQMSKPPANPQGSNPPAGAQNANSEPPPPQPSSTNPKAKRPPSAKTKLEYDAYRAAANTPDPAKAEALAREFEVQFPNSELLPFLYQQVMGKYQKADNGDKTLDMGRKVLQYDPDNIGALVMSATVLAERTRTSDIDRDQRLNEVTTYAQRAIENIRTGNYMLAPTATPEQVQQFKDQVTSMAYQALGKAEMERENYPAAEQNLRKAAEGSGKGDAIVWYRLALALDHQSKYPDATAAITTAVALAPADSAVANMAKSEQSRLRQLVAGGATPNSAPKADQPEPELVPHK
jgi:tetratricopeptide (TPR) repeat protein